ncbi:tetratricopeptide repeat protein [Streptomyces sp. NPDC052040]|uniref:tetratricopeptide repeat protein n=1 Tax=Streptomyces sp. NPDC052040 TaxID=3365682 RepID=UPI0037D118DA
MSDERRHAENRVHGRASGQGRIYQSTGDQYITEHHHHYLSPEELVFEPSLPRTVVRAQPGSPGVDLPAPDSVRTPVVGRVPRILRDRRDLMRRLSAAAEAVSGEVHVLHGMGGCGKTAIAYELFKTATREARCVGLWVNAADRATLRAGMLAVAADRGAQTVELVSAYAGQRAAADLVWHYLDASPQPWILVLDNADDPSALEDGSWLRSSPRGTVVVTTRQGTSQAWSNAELHSVGLLPLEDAARVLRDLAPASGTGADAEAMARRLECLPLALTLAGSFLSSQLLENWSMSDYQRKLDESPIEMIDRGASAGGGDGDSRQLVSKTWQLSLSTLAQAGVPESITLIRLLSCWSSDPVPLSLLHPGSVGVADLPALDPPLPQDRMEAALRGLLDHSLASLVSWQEEGDVVRCVQAHGVLLDSVYTAMPRNQRARVAESAGRILDEAVPAPLRGLAPSRGVERLVPHAATLLRRVQDGASARTAVDVASCLAGHLHNSGDYEAAFSLAEKAAERSAELLGSDNPAGFRAQHRLAAALFRQGRFVESEALYRQVIEGRRRILGPDDPETLESLQEISGPLSQMQRVDEAVRALNETEEIRARVLGPHHPDTLHARALVIEHLAGSGDVDEFDRVGPTTVATCEEVIGDSFTTVTARHNYAYGLFRLGRWEQAESAARRALADRERLHGPEHPLTLSAATLLSWILEKRGLLAESIAHGRRVVEGQEGALGAAHPYVLENRISLAGSLAAAGERAEAEELARRNLPLCERVLGADDPITLKTRRLIEDF